jgi:cytochrome c oxidase subunit 2
LILGISVAFLFVNTAVMIYFVIRYSRKRNPNPEEVKENLTIEILWTVIPTILVLIIFFVGWKGFQYMRTVPPDAMPVKVTAREWSWTFDYENGKETHVLKVPLRKPIKLIITSADVLHSLYIPAYRIKEDCVPGMETYLWFLPDELGSYDLFCTEYCGVGHSAMITKVEVLSDKDFEAWYRSKEKISEATAAETGVTGVKSEEHPHSGSELLTVKGCLACHTLDGTPKVGPTLKGIYGKKTTVLTNGKEHEITVNEEYIRRSLLEPHADIVKGFPPIMPSQKGLLTDAEIEEIIESLKTL